MELRDIHLGNIDAKNELITNSPEEIESFKKSFVTPPSLDTEKYIQGKRYFIVGLKGTGKTALLRYISIKKEEESNVKTSFVLFKSEIDEEYKKEFTQAARTTIADDNGENVSHDDYEFIWRWFIYRKLVETMENDSTEIFQRNQIYNKFKALINSPMDSSGNVKGSLSLIPRIKKGNIIVSKNPKFKLELEWDNEEKATISFNQLVRKADSEFSKLSAGDGSLDIFFDELELNHNTKKQYTRDARLIRDIIVTISKINAMCKKKGFKILLYSAVRSEVQSAVDSLGKEINKVLGDFGTEIMWNRPGIDTSQQPLLNVVTKRLRTSLGKECESDSDAKIWELFFPEKIQNSDTKSYILHHSWYRPRDIIRLLKIGQDQHPHESSFKHSVFDSIRKKYSELSWVEVTEELKSTYKNDEITGIKRLLYGFKQYFTLNEMIERCDKTSEYYEEVSILLNNHKLPKILTDLYRIGIIGNIDDSRMRFSFRGDHEILLEQKCFVHNALRSYLSL